METDRKALLFYNEDWKKDTHRKELREGGREEGEAIGLGPVLLAGNTDEGDHMCLGSSLGSEWFKPHTGHPRPGV